MAGNLEVVVAPFDLWWGAVGTASPDLAADVPGSWNKLGARQSRSMDESGIQLVRAAQDGEFRGYGAGRVSKLWTISEDLSLQFMMADFTQETMSLLVEDNQTPAETGGVENGVTGVWPGDPGTGYAVGDILTIGASGATQASVRVTKVGTNGAILDVDLVTAGSGQSAGEKEWANAATTDKLSISGTRGTRTGASVYIEVGRIGAVKKLILGRRGARLQKATFAFLARGLASPYVDGGRAQIYIPIGSFEGERNISLTRSDPIKYSCTIRCLEDAGINGYAELSAAAA